MKKNPWQPLTPSDIPEFVSCLKKYPLSMSDVILKYPMQYYRLRLGSDNAEYVKIPGMGYMALDPIGPHDAVIHFVRDPRYRGRKKNYLDNGRNYILSSFDKYNLNRISLIVVEGSYHGLVKMDTYANLLGFTFEGTIRQSRTIKEKLYDLHVFGILKGEYGPIK